MMPRRDEFKLEEETDEEIKTLPEVASTTYTKKTD